MFTSCAQLTRRLPLLLRQLRALSTVKDLQLLLRAAELRAAEAEAARVAAEKVSFLAELRAAEAEAARDKEVVARVAAEKVSFLTNMRSMSASSAASTKSRSDLHRHGAPVPTIVSTASLLRGAPAAAGNCGEVWRRYLASCPAPPAPDPDKLDERRDVHPSVKVLLSLIVPAESKRVWQEECLPDDAGGAHVAPDFTLTAARDAAPSVIGALLCIEVKLPGEITDAVEQACAYMRRRVYRLCQEADDRGEDMDKIEAFGVALDGDSVVLLRMASGAPAAGASFVGAVPCPVLQSPILPLKLNDWRTTGQQPQPQQSQSPAGLTALRRLCAAPASLLGVSTCPLQTLHATLQGVAQAGADGCSARDWGAALSGGKEVELQLGVRLGCGGSSDVYRLSCSENSTSSTSTSDSASGGECTVKLARFATDYVLTSFEAERRCLSALAGGSAPGEGLVPQCLHYGARARSAEGMPPVRRAGQVLPWPVLVLRPSGEPLEQWVEARVTAAEAGGGGGAAAAAARIAAANAVLARVLRALASAHTAGWVHCDVRPSNIVMVASSGAMLVDWGAAARAGKEARHGVLAYSASALGAAKLPLAHPAIDASGALYTWLALAHGRAGPPPWLTSHAPASDAAMLKARAEWVARLARTEPRVARVEVALKALNDALHGKRTQKALGDALAVATEALR